MNPLLILALAQAAPAAPAEAPRPVAARVAVAASVTILRAARSGEMAEADRLWRKVRREDGAPIAVFE